MSKGIFKIVLALLVALFLPVFALAGETELTWYGHSAFKIVTPSGKVLLIDPWIDNPLNKNGKEDIIKSKGVVNAVISEYNTLTYPDLFGNNFCRNIQK